MCKVDAHLKMQRTMNDVHICLFFLNLCDLTGLAGLAARGAVDAHDGRFRWLRNPFAHILICRSPNVVLAVSPLLIITISSAWQEPRNERQL